MTDRIDLDELADEPADEPDGNDGDWIWRDDAQPPGDDAEPSAPGRPTEATDGETADGGASAGSDESASSPDSSPDSAPDSSPDSVPDSSLDSAEDRTGRAIPHVPHPNKDKPVGIPVEGGGAGGGNAGGGNAGGGNAGGGNAGGEEHSAGGGNDPGTAEASGPHGGDADDMTLAFSFAAIQRFEDPAAVLADAGQWADWIGIVGDVEAHQINKFQRDHQLDVDFFNGTGRGPGERLADIDPHSMFFAERMVLVGRPGTDEAIAEHADWEFVPLETAAAEADWRLVDS